MAGEKVLVGDITLGVVAGDLRGVTGVLTEDLRPIGKLCNNSLKILYWY